jgi:RNA polymerase sigma-70 factor (ECF subfamily)
VNDQDSVLGLITRVLKGNERAWESLYELHVGEVWRLSYLLLGDQQAAEEVVQDTFVRVYQKLAEFRGTSSFHFWVQSICRNLCRDELRRRRRRQGREVSLDYPEERSRGREAQLVSPALTDDSEQSWVQHLDLKTALAELEPEQLEAFILMKVMGYRGEQAAQVTGVARTTMTYRLGRALARLAALLEKHE